MAMRHGIILAKSIPAKKFHIKTGETIMEASIDEAFVDMTGTEGLWGEPVEVANKGYGNSTTIAFDVTDVSTAKLVLLALAETVGTRLREAKVRAEVIVVGIKSHGMGPRSVIWAYTPAGKKTAAICGSLICLI